MSSQTDDEDCEELQMVAVRIVGSGQTHRAVGLDSLTDRRESVGTEDGGGISDDDIGA